MNYFIIGRGSGYTMAPIESPDTWRTITVADAHHLHPYSDIIVDIHNDKVIKEFHMPLVRESNKHKIPYYTLEKYNFIKEADEYPLNEVI